MIARWSIDTRFGHKQAVIDSLLTWRRDIGTEVGWTDDKVRIVTGSIGAPESAVELEVQITGLGELNASWVKLGAIEAHKDWSKEIEPFVFSGTPKWTIFRKDLREMIKDTGSETRQINVPVKTFQSIVSDQDLTHIDCCSIDVEGAQISVLKGIDFNKSDISLFSIENPTSPGNNQNLVRNYMENEGYKLVRSIGDDIFAKATLLG